jgi:hypothetical protein
VLRRCWGRIIIIIAVTVKHVTVEPHLSRSGARGSHPSPRAR